MAALQAAMVRTRTAIEAVSAPGQTPEERFALFKARLSGPDKDILISLDYKGKQKVAIWLRQLRALHLVVGDPMREPLTIGAAQVADAATSFARVLGKLAEVACIEADKDPSHRVSRARLARAFSGLPSISDDGVEALRRLLNPGKPENIGHWHYLCRCATVLGIITLDELDDTPGVYLVTCN